jgi:hypothetical protein
MSKFAIGEKVDNAADDHEGGTVIAVFPTVEGNFRYAVDMEGYGALQFFNEEKLERFSVDVNRNSKGVPKSAQIRFGLL